VVVKHYPAGEIFRLLLLVAGFCAGAYILWRIQEILFLLLLAIFLATAIEPIVNRLRRGPFTRGSGVLVVYTAIMLVIGFAAYVIVPNVLDEAGAFVQSAPDHLRAVREQVSGVSQPALRNPLVTVIDRAAAAIQSPTEPAQDQVVAVGTAAAQTIVGFLSVFVLAFYWLVERARIKRVVLRSVPPARARDVNAVWLEIEEKLGGWVRGTTRVDARDWRDGRCWLHRSGPAECGPARSRGRTV
jgi:predicted PurR-regulated permease PerM